MIAFADKPAYLGKIRRSVVTFENVTESVVRVRCLKRAENGGDGMRSRLALTRFLSTLLLDAESCGTEYTQKLTGDPVQLPQLVHSITS